MSAGIMGSGKNVGHGSTPFLARIPCLKDRGGVLLRPINCQRTAVGQHDDEWFSGSRNCFEKVLLWRRKIQINTVSSKKSWKN